MQKRSSLSCVWRILGSSKVAVESNYRVKDKNKSACGRARVYVRLAFIIQDVNALLVVVAEVKKISFQRIVAW